MKKNKVYIISLFIIIIIVVIIMFFLNLNKIFPKYENKIIEYGNNYQEKNNEQEFFEYVQSATYKKNILSDNEYLQNSKLYKQFIEGDAYDEFLNFIENKGIDITMEINMHLIPDTSYGNIIYVDEQFYGYNDNKQYNSYILIYNQEENKIYYKSSFEDEGQSNNDISDEKIIDIVKNKIKDLNIDISNFSPTIVKEKNNYILEDETNNIKIKYNINKNKIVSLFFNI